MAYNVTVVRQTSIDAFGRTRVSNPTNIFDSKQLFDGRTLLWSTSTATGGTITFDGYKASSTMQVTNSVGSQAIKQTKRRFNHRTGQSFQIYSSFLFGTSVAGVTKRVGYFDGYNGAFLEDDGYVRKMVLRTSVTGVPVDGYVNQTNWNLDKLDGYGGSGITIDFTKIQNLVIDFGWLGTGAIRVGFVINGEIRYAHQFLTANSGTTVSMSTPNLPIRYEITNVGAAGGSTLEQISSAVLVEGNLRDESVILAADRGASGLASIDNANLYPLVSIRLDVTRPGATVHPESISVATNTAGTKFKWALVVNPTIGGSDAASWTAITGSAVQYDVSRTISNTITGGTVIASGYGTDGSSVVEDLSTILSLGISLTNVSDELVLAVQKLGGGNDTFFGAIGWRELD